MTYTFEIDWNGATETVEINDDLPFGIIEDIRRKYVDTTKMAGGGELDIDMTGYRYAITVAAITKAPWAIKDIVVFKDIPGSVGKKVVEEVCRKYPLADCLREWIGSFMGEITPERIAEYP